MEIFRHRFSALFAQLGLPDDVAAIETFIAKHACLSDDMRLEDAPCWTTAQAQLFQEELTQDADWAEVIDQLSLALRRTQ